MLTTCPALWVQPPGGRQPSSWSLATQCDLTTSAAAPGQQVWGKGSVVHLLHHQARRTQPVLHSDFVLLGSREVDKFFPCFLGFHAGSAVGPAADQGGRLPCFLGWRGTCEGGLWSSFLPGSRGGIQLFMGWEVGGCCCRLRSSEMSGMSRSSGACLPVSLAFVSGMHVFPRGHLMPAGQA